MRQVSKVRRVECRYLTFTPRHATTHFCCNLWGVEKRSNFPVHLARTRGKKVSGERMCHKTPTPISSTDSIIIEPFFTMAHKLTRIRIHYTWLGWFSFLKVCWHLGHHKAGKSDMTVLYYPWIKVKSMHIIIIHYTCLVGNNDNTSRILPWLLWVNLRP